jgi:hypothetical protein
MACKSKTVWLFFQYGFDSGCSLYDDKEELIKIISRTEPTKEDLSEEGDSRLVMECVVTGTFKPKQIEKPIYLLMPAENN